MEMNLKSQAFNEAARWHENEAKKLLQYARKYPKDSFERAGLIAHQIEHKRSARVFLEAAKTGSIE